MSYQLSLSKRERALAVASVLCVVSLLTVYYFPLSTAGVLNPLEGRITQSEHALQTNQLFLHKQKSIVGRFNEAEQLFGKKMSDQEWSAQTMAVIRELAQGNKVELQELNSGSIERSDGIDTFKVQVSAAGDWFSLMRFFESLQSPSERFDLDDLMLEKSLGNPKLLRCQMTLSRWFFAPEQ